MAYSVVRECAVAKLVAALCPKCGAGVKLDASRDHVTCAYCGTSSFIQRDKPAPAAPSRALHESVIYVGPARNQGVLLAIVLGTLALGGGTFAFALSNAATPRAQSATQAPSAPTQPVEPTNRPSVKLGPPVVEAGDAIDGADEVIDAMRVGIRACYDEALLSSATLHGDFSLRIKVTQRATEINVRSSELPPTLLDCIQTHVLSYSFAPQQGTSVLRADGALKPPKPPLCACLAGDPLCTCP
jgi:ribosomal protein S27AE